MYYVNTRLALRTATALSLILSGLTDSGAQPLTPSSRGTHSGAIVAQSNGKTNQVSGSGKGQVIQSPRSYRPSKIVRQPRGAKSPEAEAASPAASEGNDTYTDVVWPLVYWREGSVKTDASKNTKATDLLLAFVKKHVKKSDQNLLKIVPIQSGTALRIAGPRDLVKDVTNLLATQLDVPEPQVKVTFWAVQINGDASDFEGTQDQLNTIDLGFRLCKSLAHDWRHELGNVCRRKNLLGPKKLGLDTDNDHVLSIFECALRLMNVNETQLSDEFGTGELDPVKEPITREQTFRKQWVGNLASHLAHLHVQLAADNLPGKERQQLEALVKLVEKMQQRAYSHHFMGNSKLMLNQRQGETHRTAATVSLNYFIEAITTLQKTPESGALPAFKLRSGMEETDALLRCFSDAAAVDLDYLVFDVFSDWTREVASETDQLNVLARQSLIVTSGQTACANLSATNYNPYHLRQREIKTNEDGKEKSVPASQVAFQVAQQASESKDLKDIYLNTIEGAVFQPPRPVFYDTATPGMDLSITPTMLAGAAEATLQVDLTLHSPYDNDEQQKLTTDNFTLKPVGFLKKTSLKTEVTVQTFDLFELTTQSLQTTRQGGPVWSVPVLRYLPLVGRFLFTGPSRPKTVNQGVLVLCETAIVPRSLDLVPQLIEKN